jgi:hypothetical protein
MDLKEGGGYLSKPQIPDKDHSKEKQKISSSMELVLRELHSTRVLFLVHNNIII